MKCRLLFEIPWHYVPELDCAYAFVSSEQLNYMDEDVQSIVTLAHPEDIRTCDRGDQERAIVPLALRTVQRELAALSLDIPMSAVRRIRENCTTCGAEHGRPRFTDLDETPAPYLSTSHSSGMGLIAVANRQIGVDIQSTLSLRRSIVLESRLHPNERHFVGNRHSEGYSRRSTRIWARKEAYGKAAGFGLCHKLAACDLSTWTGQFEADGKDLTTPSGFCASIALIR